MNALIRRKAIFPIYHYLKRTKIFDRIKELNGNQWKSHKELARLQRIKLEKLLTFAYQNVPFYRETFKKNRFKAADLFKAECFSEIPLLTKNDINQNRHLMIPEKIKNNKLLPNSTSGSTGEKLSFYYDIRSSVYRRASVIRNQEWLGVKICDRSACLWGSPIDLKKASAAKGRLVAWINNVKFLSSYNLSDESLEKYEGNLNKLKPKLLISYPGPLAIFAEYLIKKNRKIPSIRVIISSAETLFSWQRDLIEKAFSCKVYNRYGCREFGDLAQECSKREGLHVNSDRFIVETVDEALNPQKKGKKGELVITDLENYGMPFIRYRIGDIASFKKEFCSCGRGLPLLKQVEGRTLDIVRAPNGNRLGGTFWTLLFRSQPGIVAFQVIQESLNGITVNYVKDNENPTIDLYSFEKRIREKCGRSLKIEFTEVFSIPKTSSGKTRFVISKLKD